MEKRDQLEPKITGADPPLDKSLWGLAASDTDMFRVINKIYRPDTTIQNQ